MLFIVSWFYSTLKTLVYVWYCISRYVSFDKYIITPPHFSYTLCTIMLSHRQCSSGESGGRVVKFSWYLPNMQGNDQRYHGKKSFTCAQILYLQRVIKVIRDSSLCKDWWWTKSGWKFNLGLGRDVTLVLHCFYWCCNGKGFRKRVYV